MFTRNQKMNKNPIRVLIIDDSAFARKVIREVLSGDPEIQVVGIARDGLEGLEKISELRPDVVTLDLLMPDLDGHGVLKALPKEGRPKIIVVSVSGADSEIAIEALELGAIDIVSKPTPLPTDRLYDLSSELIFKVKAAASAIEHGTIPENEFFVPRIIPDTPVKLVVIGTSTGGPQAITKLFSNLPAGLTAPIAIALHIPEGYTAHLAARITLISKVKLEEAYDGMELISGQAVIAPGGSHLTFRRSGEKIFAVISLEPRDTPHHPSVDVLFQSAAKELGAAALGIIMTGMGSDGLLGATEIHKQGGMIIAESAESCVVYGMPRSIVEAGIADLQTPLHKMSEVIAGIIGH